MSQFDFKRVVLKHYKTIPEFSRAIGVSVPTGRKYLAYPQTMSLGMLFTLSAGLGMNTKEFVELILQDDGD